MTGQSIDFTLGILDRNTAGATITQLFASGNGSIVWSTNDQNDVTNYFSDGQLAGTRPIEFPQDATLIGAVNDRYYFASFESNVSIITEISGADGAVRTLPPQLFTAAISDYTLLDQRLYFIRQVQSSFAQQVHELVAFNPVSETTTVIRSDTYIGTRNQGRQYLATDGALLYFSAAQGAGFGPAAYSPATEMVTLLGEVNAVSPIVYFSRGGQVSINYNKSTFGEANRLLDATSLSAPLPELFPTVPDAAGLIAAWVQVGFDGRVYAVDYSGAVAILLEPAVAADDAYMARGVTKISATEALFVRRTSDTTSAIWRTDGTPDGTRIVTEAPAVVSRIVPFGQVFAIVASQELYLLDPERSVLTPVPVRLAGNPDAEVVVSGERLYFSAIDPVVGEEVHYITVSSTSDGPTAVRNTPSLEVQLYPNPTTGPVNVQLAGNAKLSVTLFNVSGHRLQQLPFAQAVPLDLTAYPPGVYILQLEDTESGARAVRRLVVQR